MTFGALIRSSRVSKSGATRIIFFTPGGGGHGSARGKQGMVQEESNRMQLLNFEFAVAGWFQISSFL
jgi:hypothetical protein